MSTPQVFNQALSPMLLLFSKSIAYLFFVQCVLLGPAYAVTLCCLVFNAILDQGHVILSQIFGPWSGTKIELPRRTVLLNGCTQSASLHVARALRSAGYRVVACDFAQNWLNPTRFSAAVDEYYTVPKPEQDGVQEYVSALCEIVQKEKVDIFLPVSTAEGAVFDSLAKSQLERNGCQCFLPPAEHVRRLSNKVTFFEHAARCGFDVPRHVQVPCISEIMHLYESGALAKNGPFVLTSLRCNHKYTQDAVFMPRNSEEFLTNIAEYEGYSCSLLLQQFISGRHLTTSTTILDGQVVAHAACCCEPPYDYDPVQTANTLAWIQTFVNMYPIKLTGNFIFNFVVSSRNDKLYPESCLAGVGVAIMSFQPERPLGESMLADVPNKIPIHPKHPRPLFWLYEEFWKTATTSPSASELFASLWKALNGHEAIFSFRDPLPFIALNHLHLPFLVFVSLLQRKYWSDINFRAGKLRS